jgi:hypothetical protein
MLAVTASQEIAGLQNLAKTDPLSIRPDKHLATFFVLESEHVNLLVQGGRSRFRAAFPTPLFLFAGHSGVALRQKGFNFSQVLSA